MLKKNVGCPLYISKKLFFYVNESGIPNNKFATKVDRCQNWLNSFVFISPGFHSEAVRPLFLCSLLLTRFRNYRDLHIICLSV